MGHMKNSSHEGDEMEHETFSNNLNVHLYGDIYIRQSIVFVSGSPLKWNVVIPPWV